MGNRNSGRRPKATALKLLRGERKDRINQAEAQPPAGEVVKPAGLSPDAAQVWDEVAPICLHMGTLTTADVQSFGTLCELQATLRKAAQEKGDPQFRLFIYTTTVDGAGNEHQQVKEHPVLGLERKTATTIRPFYEKFGLEPVGRARIAVPKSSQPADDWAALGVG